MFTGRGDSSTMQPVAFLLQLVLDQVLTFCTANVEESMEIHKHINKRIIVK